MIGRPGIGLDRRVDLSWLDTAATVALAGDSKAGRTRLYALLDGAVAGSGSHSARGKTVTVLMRTWVDVHPEVLSLRDRALAHLEQATPAERLALHWSLLSAAYPFFADVATSVGRLLTLQDSVSLTLLTQRFISKNGDRSTLRRAIQRVLRSMVEWGVLRDTSVRGVFASAGASRPISGGVGEVLLESVLYREERWSLPADQLVAHPSLFPFRVELTAYHLRSAAGLRVHRQGVDQDIVERTALTALAGSPSVLSARSPRAVIGVVRPMGKRRGQDAGQRQVAP